jgi:hypothetical protein
MDADRFAMPSVKEFPDGQNEEKGNSGRIFRVISVHQTFRSGYRRPETGAMGTDLWLSSFQQSAITLP